MDSLPTDASVCAHGDVLPMISQGISCQEIAGRDSADPSLPHMPPRDNAPTFRENPGSSQEY